MLAAPAWARLGETAEECIARYGQPVSVSHELTAITFEKEGWRVNAFFDEQGKCDLLYYSKIPKDSARTPVIQEIEVRTLMGANQLPQDLKFTTSSGTLLLAVHQAKAGRSIVGYDPLKGYVTVASESGIQYVLKNLDAKNQALIDALKGF